MNHYFTDYRSRLIGKNVEYYEPRMNELDSSNKKTSWNWFAFLVPFVWFAYRKMYLECIAYYLITNGLNTVITNIFIRHSIAVNVGWTIDILAMFLCGLYGNWLYKNKLDRQAGKCMDMPPEQRETYIRRHGGASVPAIIISFCITIAIAAVLYNTVDSAGMAV